MYNSFIVNVLSTESKYNSGVNITVETLNTYPSTGWRTGARTEAGCWVPDEAWVCVTLDTWDLGTLDTWDTSLRTLVTTLELLTELLELELLSPLSRV